MVAIQQRIVVAAAAAETSRRLRWLSSGVRMGKGLLMRPGAALRSLAVGPTATRCHSDLSAHTVSACGQLLDRWLNRIRAVVRSSGGQRDRVAECAAAGRWLFRLAFLFCFVFVLFSFFFFASLSLIPPVVR